MTAKKLHSNQKKTSNKKEQKEPKGLRIDVRVSLAQHDMIERLMKRFGKNKTELFLFALERLRQRIPETPSPSGESSSQDQEFVGQVIKLLNNLTTTYRFSASDLTRIDAIKAWANPDTTQHPPLSDEQKRTGQIEPSADFLDAEELLDELKFMDRQITLLRKETIQLEHSAYRKNALELITAITQSHDALVDSLK